MNSVQEYTSDLQKLIAGTIRASSIIGKGYKAPKGVASAWLRLQIHNLQHPEFKVHQVHVTAEGLPYSSESRAKRSKAFAMLETGKYETINNSTVSDYGITHAAGSVAGYMIWVRFSK